MLNIVAFPQPLLNPAIPLYVVFSSDGKFLFQQRASGGRRGSERNFAH